MRQINRTRRNLLFRLLFALVLISGCSINSFAQTLESEESPNTTVPERIMEQVIQRVLAWSFKPRNRPTVIYLGEQGIKQSWLPTIKNIEFRLLSSELIQQKELKVHFFTKPDLSRNTYNIGFAFGDPNCEYIGDHWHFRLSKQRIRLWQNGGVHGGCGSGSSF